MPLRRDYRLMAGLKPSGGYPCIGQPAQRLTEALNRSCPKAKVGMRLDTPAGSLAPLRLRVYACVMRVRGACARRAYPPPRRGPARVGDPLKFSPAFHGTGF